MNKVRKVPMRKCVGCNEQKSKKELIRVLKTPEDRILMDATGRQNGRGAYLCRNPQCLAKARKNKGRERSLQIQIPAEVYEQLDEELRTLDE